MKKKYYLLITFLILLIAAVVWAATWTSYPDQSTIDAADTFLFYDADDATAAKLNEITWTELLAELLADFQGADTNNTGLLSDTDWDTFNEKAAAGITTVTDANGFTMSAAQCLSGVVVYATGAGTIVMCPVLSTSSFTVIDYGGAAVVLNPDATGTEDTIILDGTILAQGDGVTSTSTTGDMIVCTYQAADIWYCASGSPDGDHWTDTN